MQTNKILSAPLIDLIFDGRNKEYGAYELRSTYERRIKKSLLITVTILAVSIGGAAIAGSLKKNEPRFNIIPGVQLVDIPVEKELEPLPKPKKKQADPQVQTQKFTTPTIVPEEDFDEPLPAQSDLDSARVGLVTVEGTPDEGGFIPPQEGEKNGIVDVRPNKPEEIFTTVEIEAKFNGNWRAFLERNVNAEVPIDNNAPAGRYSVVIQFVVDVNGNVSDIKALTSHGYGMEEEAIRVLRKAAKWEPAIQNGNQVKAYRRQPITFDVQSE